VIAAPSGAGKTSLVKALLEVEPRLAASVSHTTRAPRPTEQNGREYHFVSPEAFAELVLAGGFLEHAQVFDNQYGTGREQLEAQLAAGRDVILEIDWQGAAQVRQMFSDTVSVFILPPSLQELERRLRARGKDSEPVIGRRIAAAQSEIRHAHEFNYAIINNDFHEARADLEAIVRASRTATRRQQLRHPDLF